MTEDFTDIKVGDSFIANGEIRTVNRVTSTRFFDGSAAYHKKNGRRVGPGFGFDFGATRATPERVRNVHLSNLRKRIEGIAFALGELNRETAGWRRSAAPFKPEVVGKYESLSRLLQKALAEYREAEARGEP